MIEIPLVFRSLRHRCVPSYGMGCRVLLQLPIGRRWVFGLTTRLPFVLLRLLFSAANAYTKAAI